MLVGVDNQAVNNNATFTSNARYVGSTNAAYPLMAASPVSIFVKGAAASVSVKLQAAFKPTLPDQSNVPVDADYIDVATYTTNTVTSLLSLNGLWIRFLINNTSGSTATVSCQAA